MLSGHSLEFFSFFAIAGDDQSKILPLSTKLAAGPNYPDEPFGFDIRSEHGGGKNYRIVFYIPISAQFFTGLFVKGKFIWDNTRCHIGNPVFGQKTFEIEQVDRFIAENVIGGTKGFFVQIKSRFRFPLAPALGGINALKYDIRNIQFSGDRGAQ